MMSSVLLLLMWSCSSDNDAPENGEEVPILLSSSFSSATRAGHEDEIDPEATNRLLNFWVYGYKTVAGNDIQMMNQQLVSRDAAGFPWTYSPLKYWDRAASKYLFVGYTPNSGVSIKNDTKVLSFTDIPQWQPYSESVNTEDGIQTVYNSSANDYMVAKSTDSPANYLSSANPYRVGYVHLDFRHLLSKLTIKAYCPPNEESAERTKYVIQNVSLGSKGYTTQGAGGTELHYDILPESGNYRTASYKVNENEITVPSIATTGHEGHENEKLPLYYKADDKQDEYMMPSSGSESNPPCEVCSWLIAPFSLTERFTDYSETDKTKNPKFTIQVTYWAKTKNDATGEFEYTSKVVSKSLELVNAADEPLFMEFEPGKEYVITLKIDKQLAEVLVDVSVTPWKESETNASPHTVYNW